MIASSTLRWGHQFDEGWTRKGNPALRWWNCGHAEGKLGSTLAHLGSWSLTAGKHKIAISMAPHSNDSKTYRIPQAFGMTILNQVLSGVVARVSGCGEVWRTHGSAASRHQRRLGLATWSSPPRKQTTTRCGSSE